MFLFFFLIARLPHHCTLPSSIFFFLFSSRVIKAKYHHKASSRNPPFAILLFFLLHWIFTYLVHDIKLHAREQLTHNQTYTQNALDYNCSLFAASNTHWDTLCNRQSQTTAISWLVVGVNKLKVETSKHKSHEGHGLNGGELLSKANSKI